MAPKCSCIIQIVLLDVNLYIIIMCVYIQYHIYRSVGMPVICH